MAKPPVTLLVDKSIISFFVRLLELYKTTYGCVVPSALFLFKNIISLELLLYVTSLACHNGSYKVVLTDKSFLLIINIAFLVL